MKNYIELEKVNAMIAADPYKPSLLALQIMTYRRQYNSLGISEFCENWLSPKLTAIMMKLSAQGYTVAYNTVGSNEAGKLNYCIDVSKKDMPLSEVLFVAHYDTVDREAYKKTGVTELTRKYVSIKDDIAYLDITKPQNADVNCLGADDGAGLAVMLNLMANGVLGGYCFTTGEECGGIGANAVHSNYHTFLKQYKIAVEIDRAGVNEIIKTQAEGECASEEFTQWLCTQLGMNHKPSDYGSYTDVSTFAMAIPECVNISAGYLNQHTTKEIVNLKYLDMLAEKVANVQWSIAPIVREAGDYGDFGYNSWGYYGRASKGKIDYKALQEVFCNDEYFLEHFIESLGISSREIEIVLEDYFGYGNQQGY